MSRGTGSEYVVHTGDTTYYFEHGRRYKKTYIRQVFKKKVAPIELFPGLVLQDEEGNLFKPELQVVLVPVVEPEEEKWM